MDALTLIDVLSIRVLLSGILGRWFEAPLEFNSLSQQLFYNGTCRSVQN